MHRYKRMLKTFLQDQKEESYNQMKKDGELEEYLTMKAEAAIQRKQSLLESGMPDDMAEEVARSELLAV